MKKIAAPDQRHESNARDCASRFDNPMFYHYTFGQPVQPEV
jgi:hypothetical protein